MSPNDASEKVKTDSLSTSIGKNLIDTWSLRIHCIFLDVAFAISKCFACNISDEPSFTPDDCWSFETSKLSSGMGSSAGHDNLPTNDKNCKNSSFINGASTDFRRPLSTERVFNFCQ